MSPAIDDALNGARKALVACEALFRAGLYAECHPFMLRALRAALMVWAEPAPMRDPSSLPPSAPAAEPAPAVGTEETALTALAAAGYPHLERLRAALELSEATMPTDFEWVWAEADRLVRFSARRLLPERARRRRRFGYAAALAIVGIVAVVFAARLWGRWRVRASATLSTDFPASNAIDGNAGTEWLPPDEHTGWLEIRLPRPRHVHHVRVFNGHNRFYVDRGSGKFRVTLFAGERAITSAEGHFDRITDAITMVDVPIAGDGVTMVRVEVLTFLGRGAAIGEVELE